MIHWVKAKAAMSLIDQPWPDMKQALWDDVFHTHSGSMTDQSRDKRSLKVLRHWDKENRNEWRTRREGPLFFFLNISPQIAPFCLEPHPSTSLCSLSILMWTNAASHVWSNLLNSIRNLSVPAVYFKSIHVTASSLWSQRRLLHKAPQMKIDVKGGDHFMTPCFGCTGKAYIMWYNENRKHFLSQPNQS